MRYRFDYYTEDNRKNPRHLQGGINSIFFHNGKKDYTLNCFSIYFEDTWIVCAKSIQNTFELLEKYFK